jgi:hypothetical protein
VTTGVKTLNLPSTRSIRDAATQRWADDINKTIDLLVRQINFTVVQTGLDHGGLTGLGDDDHSQYYNSARIDTWLGTKDTGDLAEGSNLYYTEARVSANTDVSANTTHRTSSGVDHSLLTATAGTASASKALVVDSNKDINLDGGDITAVDGTFSGDVSVSDGQLSQNDSIGADQFLSLHGTSTLLDGEIAAGKVDDGSSGGIGLKGGDFGFNSGNGQNMSGAAPPFPPGLPVLSGDGGILTFLSGLGGTASSTDAKNLGGNGGGFLLTGGRGGHASGAGGGANTGGVGASPTITGGDGGNATNGSTNTGGDAGSVVLLGGTGGTGATAQGDGGSIYLDSGAGATDGDIYLGQTRGNTYVEQALSVSGLTTLSNNVKFDTSVDSSAVADEVSLGRCRLAAMKYRPETGRWQYLKSQRLPPKQMKQSSHTNYPSG